MSTEIDDQTVLEDERLLRRVRPEQIVPDENAGTYRISSAAFMNPSDGTGMSVSIQSTLFESGLGHEDVLRGYEMCGLVALTAKIVRSHRQKIVRRPLEGDPSHGEVVGKKTRQTRREFARLAEWIKSVAPPDV